MIKVTIPPKTLLKILLRGISDMSMVSAIKNAQVKIGSRKGITLDNGTVVWFERIAKDEIVVVSVYHKAKRDVMIGKRAVALTGFLINCITAKVEPFNLFAHLHQKTV